MPHRERIDVHGDREWAFLFSFWGSAGRGFFHSSDDFYCSDVSPWSWPWGRNNVLGKLVEYISGNDMLFSSHRQRGSDCTVLRLSQWRMANFDPLQNRNPWTDWHKIWHTWLPRASIPMGQGGQVPSNIWTGDTVTNVPQYLSLPIVIISDFSWHSDICFYYIYV